MSKDVPWGGRGSIVCLTEKYLPGKTVGMKCFSASEVLSCEVRSMETQELLSSWKDAVVVGSAGREKS